MSEPRSVLASTGAYWLALGDTISFTRGDKLGIVALHDFAATRGGERRISGYNAQIRPPSSKGDTRLMNQRSERERAGGLSNCR
jgi:hypothetical protein